MVSAPRNAVERTALPHSAGSYTAGIDLAAEPKGTALAIVEWTPTGALLVELRVGIADGQIVEILSADTERAANGSAGACPAAVDAIGIDCAFGWPDDFLAFITDHSAGRRVDRSLDEGMEWRRRLAYRETDRDARVRTGRWPLSVATDRLGLTALHCAALLDLLGERFGTVDRSGGGLVAEVYPGATLRLWNFDTRGYKADPAARRILIDVLIERAPWLNLNGFLPTLIASDDAFDAMIAAIAARAKALGYTSGPPEHKRDQARREGWIALPTVELDALDPRQP